MAQKSPVLHVIVIGFHHKKGCQVEFSYPPLMPAVADAVVEANAASTGATATCAAAAPTTDCPAGWKYLPTLGLPDGSHNFTEDSVFFNLPSLVEPNETVFGVSCYRQIPVDQLKIRTADVTRSTVQKSVCVLATVPVYGYVEVKLSLIAQSYFEQGDFERTDILCAAYHQLNACLREAAPLALHQHHFHVGLPLRDIVLRWRYKLLILFKLWLLQKRVVCFGSPVRPVCSLILAVTSLHAQQLAAGLTLAACVRTSRPMSPMPTFGDRNRGDGDDAAAMGNDNDNNKEVEDGGEPCRANGNATGHKTTTATTTTTAALLQTISVDRSDAEEDNVSSCSTATASGGDDPNRNTTTDASEATEAMPTAGAELAAEPPLVEGGAAKLKGSLPRDASVDVLSNRLQPLCAHDPLTWHAPFPLYTAGHLLLPYLSLPYMDLLSDASVRGYTIGTSNILFQQKKQLADVFVDIESGNIETSQPEIRRQLQLTTEDLRFVDFVLRHVQAPRESAEGSEQWIRAQFHGYFLALLRTAMQQQQQQQQQQQAFNATTVGVASNGVALSDTDAEVTTASAAATTTAAAPAPMAVTPGKDAEHFNAFFVAEWLQTPAWREWQETMATDGGVQRLEEEVIVGHPFAGTLSVADMKLKLAQTMNNSESGRKLNQAVNTTSKAVGGAILQARGALSNWWSSMTTAPPSAPAATASTTPPLAGLRPTSEPAMAHHRSAHDLTRCARGAEEVRPMSAAGGSTAGALTVATGIVEIGREAADAEATLKGGGDAEAPGVFTV